MMPTCTSCGAPLQGRARFCNNCGAPAPAPAGVATVADSPPTPPLAQEPVATEPLMEVRVSLLKYVLRPRLWLIWAVLVGVLVGWVLLGLPPIGIVALVAVTVIVLCFWWLTWRANKLVIYPDRVVRHEGVFNRTERTDPLWRIQDVTLQKKWYGLGWVFFETAGDESDSGFGPITNATGVRDAIYQLIRHHVTP